LPLLLLCLRLPTGCWHAAAFAGRGAAGYRRVADKRRQTRITPRRSGVLRARLRGTKHRAATVVGGTTVSALVSTSRLLCCLRAFPLRAAGSCCRWPLLHACALPTTATTCAPTVRMPPIFFLPDIHCLLLLCRMVESQDVSVFHIPVGGVLPQLLHICRLQGKRVWRTLLFCGRTCYAGWCIIQTVRGVIYRTGIAPAFAGAATCTKLGHRLLHAPYPSADAPVGSSSFCLPHLFMVACMRWLFRTPAGGHQFRWVRDAKQAIHLLLPCGWLPRAATG